MDKGKILTITETRKNLFEMIEKVQLPGSSYILTERGRPKAVLISFDEYESLLETIDVLEESPNIMQEIKQAHEEFERGDYYIFEDKGDKIVYEKVQGNHQKRSSKVDKKAPSKRSIKN